MDQTEAQETAQLLLRAVATRFPEWPVPSPSPSTNPEVVSLELPLPGRSSHTLSFRVSAMEVEVVYTDGKRSGPAEALFIFEDKKRENGVAGVVTFLNDLAEARVVVGKTPLSKLMQRLRGGDLDSLLSFIDAKDLTPDRRRQLSAVYSWIIAPTTSASA